MAVVQSAGIGQGGSLVGNEEWIRVSSEIVFAICANCGILPKKTMNQSGINANTHPDNSRKMYR